MSTVKKGSKYKIKPAEQFGSTISINMAGGKEPPDYNDKSAYAEFDNMPSVSRTPPPPIYSRVDAWHPRDGDDDDDELKKYDQNLVLSMDQPEDNDFLKEFDELVRSPHPQGVDVLLARAEQSLNKMSKVVENI